MDMSCWNSAKSRHRLFFDLITALKTPELVLDECPHDSGKTMCDRHTRQKSINLSCLVSKYAQAQIAICIKIFSEQETEHFAVVLNERKT